MRQPACRQAGAKSRASPCAIYFYLPPPARGGVKIIFQRCFFRYGQKKLQYSKKLLDIGEICGIIKGKRIRETEFPFDFVAFGLEGEVRPPAYRKSQVLRGYLWKKA